MNKTHLMSALALAFVLAAVSSTTIYATENTNSETTGASVSATSTQVAASGNSAVSAGAAAGAESKAASAESKTATVGGETGATGATVARGSSELRAATDAVEQAIKTVGEGSSTYPGVSEYLQGLVNSANEPDVDEEALIEAMNNAAKTANILFGSHKSPEYTNPIGGGAARTYVLSQASVSKAVADSGVAAITVVTESKTATDNGVVAVDAASGSEVYIHNADQSRAELAVAKTQGNGVSVRVEVAALEIDNAVQSETSEGKNDATEGDTDEAPEVPEGVELPRTGADDEKMGLNKAVTIVAGIVVVAITLLATVLVVKEKRQQR